MTVIDQTWYHRPPGVGDRTGAGGVVVRREGHRLLVGLVQEDGFPEYILPKGRLEPGEEIEEAARREIAEEAGLTGLQLLGKLGVRERLDFRRRQWVTTHYFLYTSTDSASMPTDVEHTYRLDWFPIDALPAMFWPEQRELLETNRDLLAALVKQTKLRPWRIEPLTEARWPDLVDLFGPRGASGGCWCMWWRLSHTEFQRGKGEGNRAALEALVRAGNVPGLLAYDGERPVGWCSLGPREEFPRLARSRIVKPVDDIPVWSVVCFYVDRGYRNQGVTLALLEAAKAYAQGAGASMLEAYPTEAGDRHLAPAFAYTGLASAFRQAGFVEVARRSPTRPIMRCTLAPPPVDDIADPRAFFGPRAGYYTGSPAHRDPAGLAALVALVNPQSHWRVLDLATGTGHTALAFAPRVRSVVGLDVTPPMLAEAGRLARAQRVNNLDLCLADAQALPFEEGSFDLITCRRAAHHFRDLRGALAEAHRVLRPGGLLLVEDRSVPEDEWSDAMMNRLDRLHDPSHVREYRPSEWRARLEESGFQVQHLALRTLQRPLTALTDNASEAAAHEIVALVDAWTPAQRTAMDVRGSGARASTGHWYVTVVARRP